MIILASTEFAFENATERGRRNAARGAGMIDTGAQLMAEATPYIEGMTLWGTSSGRGVKLNGLVVEFGERPAVCDE